MHTASRFPARLRLHELVDALDAVHRRNLGAYVIVTIWFAALAAGTLSCGIESVRSGRFHLVGFLLASPLAAARIPYIRAWWGACEVWRASPRRFAPYTVIGFSEGKLETEGADGGGISLLAAYPSRLESKHAFAFWDPAHVREFFISKRALRDAGVLDAFREMVATLPSEPEAHAFSETPHVTYRVAPYLFDRIRGRSSSWRIAWVVRVLVAVIALVGSARFGGASAAIVTAGVLVLAGIGSGTTSRALRGMQSFEARLWLEEDVLVQESRFGWYRARWGWLGPLDEDADTYFLPYRGIGVFAMPKSAVTEEQAAWIRERVARTARR